jgi:putative ABC transport system permease protein
MVSEAMAEEISAQYAEGVQAQLGALTTDQLSAALTAALTGADGVEALTSEQYDYLYDNYMPATLSEGSFDENMDTLGYLDLESPTSISIYCTSFADKDTVADLIDQYNDSVGEDDEITYTDYVALLMSSITTIINAISYVLIAFVAISLVVSSIMIGIITYISVLERTKEIGILRAMGASKKDVSRVFNAETLIVGFCAGAIGIIVTVLLCIPANLIIHSVTGIMTLSAALPWAAGVILVLISMLLTFIAGLIPARIAAKKDPVVALRTE